MVTNRFRRGLTTRRRLLAGVAGTSVSAAAGCLASVTARQTLHSYSESGGDPVALFALEPAAGAFHQRQVDDGYVDSLAGELRETGTVETIEDSLVDDRPSGEDGYVPSYVETDDGFSRVRVHAEPVTLDRWIVWMEPLEEIPDDVEYVTAGGPESFPIEELSELDEAILSSVADAVIRSELDGKTHTDLPLSDRGIVFFDPLDPEDSDLVSDPPFEYALVGVPFDVVPWDDIPMQIHVDNESIETTRYVHELDLVASSREEFMAHVRSEHVEVQYTSDDLDDQRREIIDESRTVLGYDERIFHSDAFEELLADLALGDVAVPEGEEVASWLRYYEYDERFYEARYRISHL